MGILRNIFVTAAGLFLCGCATTGQLSTQAINAPAIEKVQAEIKRQIGVYFADVYAHRKSPRGSATLWCGDGDIDFDIVSVKVDLLTTRDEINSGKLGLKIPVIGGAGSVSPSGSMSKTVTNTQQLSYNEYVLADRFQPTELTSKAADHSKPSPIADIITSERDALIGAAVRSSHPEAQPCFTNFNPAEPLAAQNTLIIGIKFESDGKGGLDVDLGVISFGGSLERKSSFANTVTVTFRQHGLTKKSIVGACPGAAGTACVWDPISIASQPTGANPQPGISSITKVFAQRPQRKRPNHHRGTGRRNVMKLTVAAVGASAGGRTVTVAKAVQAPPVLPNQCRLIGKPGIETECPVDR